MLNLLGERHGMRHRLIFLVKLMEVLFSFRIFFSNYLARISFLKTERRTCSQAIKLFCSVAKTTVKNAPENAKLEVKNYYFCLTCLKCCLQFSSLGPIVLFDQSRLVILFYWIVIYFCSVQKSRQTTYQQCRENLFFTKHFIDIKHF